MTKLALSLPGFSDAIDSPTKQAKPQFQDLGSLLSGGYSILLLIVAFLMVYWLSWGIFQYIFAGGEKEKLAHAKKRITWAIVGFIIVVLAFTIRGFVEETFTPQNTLTPVSVPGAVSPNQAQGNSGNSGGGTTGGGVNPGSGTGNTGNPNQGQPGGGAGNGGSLSLPGSGGTFKVQGYIPGQHLLSN